MFEFDPAKSAANHEKHGIDFSEARKLWDDAAGIEAAAPYNAEPRYIRIAQTRGKCWFAVFTMRGENIRIISVRRARRKEQDAYEQAKSKP